MTLEDVELYRAALDSIADGVIVMDRDRVVTFWNRAAERLTGLTADQTVGRTRPGHIFLVSGGHDAACLACPAEAAIREGRTVETEAYVHRACGRFVPVRIHTSPVRDASGATLGAVEVIHDNSASLAALERIRTLEQEALTDALTGGGNRRYGEMALRSFLTELQGNRRSFAVAFLDIDSFKTVNDTFGHDVGDAVLRLVMRKLQWIVRTTDVVVRWGGEEFVVLLSDVAQAQLGAISNHVERLLAGLSMETPGGTIDVSISAGFTIARPNDTPESVVRRADSLMYAAKRSGRGRVLSYVPQPTIGHEGDSAGA